MLGRSTNKKKVMDKTHLIEVVEQGLTLKEIGLINDCSNGTVRYWLDKYNLKTKRGQKSLSPLCKCGESDPDKFYGHKKRICGKCHNKYTLKIGQKNRKRAIKYLGGECIVCGYSKYTCSLDFHHIDPLLKDVKFANMRNWSWHRTKKEIKKCVLLCKNCHAAIHAKKLYLERSVVQSGQHGCPGSIKS